MKINNFEHDVISRFFSYYNREKSCILCVTMSGGISEYFCAHIYRKGKFKFWLAENGNFKIKKL